MSLESLTLSFFVGINGISGAKLKHLHNFGIKSQCFTAQSGAKQHQQEQPTAISEVSGATSKNIFINVKNVDKLKIEISIIGYIITFVTLATQERVLKNLQCKHTEVGKSTKVNLQE